MLTKPFLKSLILITYLLLFTTNSNSSLLTSTIQGGTTLPNAPGYDWWYGCSPTSAGMMMGHYDTNGYDDLLYNSLINGAATDDFQDSNVRNAIASTGHRDGFYPGNMMSNVGKIGDDTDNNSDGIADRTVDTFNSLADFMGTSQDEHGLRNGSTRFWAKDNGQRLYSSEMGDSTKNSSGMYGILEYIQWAGYDVAEIYNQRTDNAGLTFGFSFDNYKTEIDLGRVVMVHVTGHSMFGYGYDDEGNILFRNTWDTNEHSMAWGTSYDTDNYGLGKLDLWGVTTFTLTGGDKSSPVPEPATIILFTTGIAGLISIKRIKKS